MFVSLRSFLLSRLFVFVRNKKFYEIVWDSERTMCIHLYTTRRPPGPERRERQRRRREIWFLIFYGKSFLNHFYFHRIYRHSLRSEKFVRLFGEHKFTVISFVVFFLQFKMVLSELSFKWNVKGSFSCSHSFSSSFYQYIRIHLYYYLWLLLDRPTFCCFFLENKLMECRWSPQYS